MTEERIKGNGRTFFGRFSRTQNQVKLAFVFIGGVLFALGSMIAVLITQLTQTIFLLEMNQKIDPEAALVLRETLSRSFVFFVAIAAIVSCFSFIFGVRIANRIFGPMIPIKRHVEKLKEGEYSSRLQLRENDEFSEIAAELNHLAAHLEARSNLSTT